VAMMVVCARCVCEAFASNRNGEGTRKRALSRQGQYHTAANITIPRLPCNQGSIQCEKSLLGCSRAEQNRAGKLGTPRKLLTMSSTAGVSWGDEDEDMHAE
jgi:hypothetical protein